MVIIRHRGKVTNILHSLLFEAITFPLWWKGGLRTLMTKRAMLAGASGRGSASYTKVLKGQGPDEEHSLVIQVGGCAL
jgi:hypothetical protein